MHKKILVLAPYPYNKAPSQRLKFEQYYPFFKDAGYQVVNSSFISENFWDIIYKPGNIHLKIWYTILGYIRRTKDLFRASKYDIVYIHLWVTPFGPPIFEWLISKFNPRIIYDIDDLIYLGPTSKSNSIVHFIKGKNKPKALMKMAKHVIVCTPTLNEHVKKYNTSVTDISSTINTDTYIAKKVYGKKNQIVLGWSGSHSTSKYLYMLKDVLLNLKSIIDFKLFVIGDPDFEINGIEIESKKWEESSEVEDLLKIDIGLYPLPDEEWVYGKSGLKALQYMALGIPTIATAIGANFRIIENNKSGFLIPPGEDKGWISAILKLVNDHKLQERIGKNGRAVVEKNYSLLSNKHKYLDIIDDVCSPVEVQDC